jgi:hypothetical protein
VGGIHQFVLAEEIIDPKLLTRKQFLIEMALYTRRAWALKNVKSQGLAALLQASCACRARQTELNEFKEYKFFI